MGDAVRPRREVEHRPAERAAGPGAVHRVEGEDTKEKKWYAGETISVSIGQGQVSVTPISLAVYTATLANGGTRVTPHLVKAIDDGTRAEAGADAGAAIEGRGDGGEAAGDPRGHVARRQRRLRHRRGARAIPGKDVCGKTGTAQVISLQGRMAAGANSTTNLRDHGWFTFFAPRDNPEIAGVVFLEHGIHSANAASVAKHILADLLREEGRQAAAAAADARRDAARHERSRSRSRRGRRGRSVAAMFERRLYFHVDWLLLGAILVLSGIGVAMIYSTTYITTADRRPRRPAGLDPALRARPRPDRAARLPRDRLPHARRALAVHLRRAARAAHLRAREGADADGRPALDPDRAVPPAALGVRPHRRGAAAGDVLRREPPRREEHRRPHPRRHLHRHPAPAHRQAAGPRHGGDAHPGLRRRRLPRRPAPPAPRRAGARRPCSPRPIAWKFALKDYQRSRIETFIDPEQDPRGAGLPDHPGPRHRRLRRPHRQGLPATARRGSTSSCRSPTTTSSSRSSRKSRASSACSPRWASICS